MYEGELEQRLKCSIWPIMLRLLRQRKDGIPELTLKAPIPYSVLPVTCWIVDACVLELGRSHQPLGDFFPSHTTQEPKLQIGTRRNPHASNTVDWAPPSNYKYTSTSAGALLFAFPRPSCSLTSTKARGRNNTVEQRAHLFTSPCVKKGKNFTHNLLPPQPSSNNSKTNDNFSTNLN